ncbi:MAG TPA: LysR substrate-binding domain-containing protein [Xanthobacteraceae bacterium]|nr:LysR substrate-binding domain-containing protein [Xanthobacteraceae bacterium]
MLWGADAVIKRGLPLCEAQPHNRPMELRHLRYFVAVAEELHFSRAAARLNIATPTLSAQIQGLEALLGAQLFVRKTRSVALTHVGQRFLDEARATLKQAEHAELVGRRAARGDMGSIAVGYVLSAACRGYVASSILDFGKLHPDVSFQLRKMETFPQMKALIDGTLDVGFARAPHRYPTELTGFIIDRQALWLAIPTGHRLASRKVIEPAMLTDEHFVATSLEMDVGFWGNIQAITLPGMSLKVATRVPDAYSVLIAVAAGMGLGVLSESLTNIVVPGVVCRKIVKAARTSDHVVAYRKNEGAPGIKAFIAQLRARARSV